MFMNNPHGYHKGDRVFVETRHPATTTFGELETGEFAIVDEVLDEGLAVVFEGGDNTVGVTYEQVSPADDTQVPYWREVTN